MGDRPGGRGAVEDNDRTKRVCDSRNRRGSAGVDTGSPCPSASAGGKRVTPASVLCLFFIFLVPLAAAGLSLINTGLGRSRSASHAMLTALCVMAIAAMAYFFCGFAWQGFAGGAAHSLPVAGKEGNWVAAEPLFLRGRPLDGSPVSLAVLLQMLSVGLAALDRKSTRL